MTNSKAIRNVHSLGVRRGYHTYWSSSRHLLFNTFDVGGSNGRYSLLDTGKDTTFNATHFINTNKGVLSGSVLSVEGVIKTFVVRMGHNMHRHYFNLITKYFI